MEKRIIFHVDVNNAFLSWSAVLLLKQGYKIDIRKIPSIIGGDESKRHGIVLAKSPVAKKIGIKTAETIYTARKKCPNIKVFAPNYKWYYEQSYKFHQYLKQYSPNVEKYSVDEAYIDFSGTKYMYDNYIELAYKIKNDIKNKFGFTVNVGIANNMLCAKMASDFEKPDKVHTLFENEIKDKMWNLPIEELFMVGKSTSSILRKIGINTIGELANTDILILKKYFKNQAIFLKYSANGIDESKVEKSESKNPSISISETLSSDVNDLEILESVLFRQATEISRQLRNRGKYCNVIAIIYKNSNFESYSKQIKLPNSTNNTNVIFEEVKKLLMLGWRKDYIRLIGIRLGDISENFRKQISLFDIKEDSNFDDKFQETMDEINNRFGKNTLYPASMKNTKNKI